MKKQLYSIFHVISFWLHEFTFRLFKNNPVVARLSVVSLAIIIIATLSFKILPKLPTTQPSFHRTPLSNWNYATASSQGELTSRFRASKEEAQVQVSRHNSSITFVTALTKPVLAHTDNELIYTTDNNLVTLNYQPLINGIKENILLTADPQTNIFSSQVVLKNLFPRLSADQQLYFVNDDEEYQFHLEKPFAYDASGSKTYGVRYKLLRTPPDEQREESVYSNPLDVFAKTIAGSTSKEILGATQTPTTDQQTYQLVLEVDPAWLNNPNRKYPITIDPTVIHDESSEFGGEKNQIKDFGSGVNPQLEATYQELTADSQTAALWHLENSWNDSSSGGSHATANNGATFSTNNPVGSYGGEFDGSNDYAVTNSVSGPTQQVTIEAWVRPDTLSGDDKGLVIKQNQLSLEIETDNNCIDFAVYNTNTSGWEELQPTNCALPEGKWSHLAATYDGTTLRVYQNGVEVGSQSGNGLVMNNTTNPYYLGYNPFYGTRYLDGGLDEVRVSYVARTAEEIRAAAQRYPSAVYTSNVIDLGTVSSLDSFSWEEAGVATGDGETLFNNTGLVAQWNFNETSGTTLDNAEGTTSLDGTLTNFSNTSGQDALARSGWTSNNRRWGTGALMFDGSNDYVSMGTASNLNFTSQNFTLEGWLNLETYEGSEKIILGNGVSQNSGYYLYIATPTHQLDFSTHQSGARQDTRSVSDALEPGKWHHLAVTRNGSNVTIYVDGKDVTLTHETHVSPASATNNFVLGTYPSNPSSLLYRGSMDSWRAYSRVLSQAEIAANAQAGQLEMQTRTSADGSSWSSWTPATGNTQIESFDAASTTYDDISVRSTLYPANSTGLQHYWAFDEAVDNSCSGGEDACDSTGSNHLTANGNSNIVSGVYKNGRYFDGSGDTLSDTNFSIPAQGTVTFWMVPQPDSTRQRIFGSLDNFEFNIESGNVLSNQLGAAGSDSLNSSTVLNNGQLYFVAATYDTVSTNQMTIYLDGQLDSSSSQADDNPSGTQTFTIGTRTGSTDYYTGMLDEFRFYDSVLDGTAIQALYEQSAPQNHHILTENDTVIKQEGASSNKISAGLTVASDTTTGLWHLDETNGDLGGADVFDSSINGYDGEFTGSSIATNVVDGVIDMARGFNGSDDRIDFSSSATIANSSTYTISAWFKADSASTTEGNIYGEGNTGTDTPLLMLKVNSGDVDGDLRYVQRGDGSSSAGLTLTDQDYSDNQWHHVVVVRTSASDFEMFVDGRSKGTFSGSPGTTTMNVATLGALHRTSLSAFFDGAIDEVFTSTIALTADEVAELYRLGKGHPINYSLSSTDLSSSKYLPVYVAADKPGNYLQAILGESEFANNQPDANTIGLWHMNDDWTDSSSNNYNATPNGNAAFTTNSRLGSSAGLFDGTGDYLNVGDIDSIDTATNLSGCAWVNHATDTADQEIFAKSNSTNDGFLFFRDEAGSQSGRTDTYTIYISDGTDSDSVRIEGATNAALANQWNYVCFTFQAGSSTGLHLYVNGVEDPNSPVSTTSITNVNSTTNNFVIGATSQIAAFFDGSIDEVHLFDRILSATEIRQAYEIGDRTHQIPINFAAHLNSSNLISDSNDTSFTIDATARGFTMAGAHLYPEEKVIIKENSGGTEYIAQGTVSSITHSSGAVTVDSWDAGSTFPSGGFTANATVFKWQRFFLDISTVLDQFQDGVDLLTLQVTDNHQGRTIWIDDLEKSTGALSNPAGESISSPTNRYFQYRMTTTNHDANISPQLTSVTLDYTDNSLPSSPVLDDAYLPDNTALPDTTPELRFISTDGEGDDLVYQVQVDTDADFASATSYTSDTASGFTNIDSGGDTSPFTSGNKISYTFQSALTNDTTYFYRVRAIDPSGTNTYSNWSSIRSLTIDTSTSKYWLQTHADQFATDDLTGVATVNDSTDSVYLDSNTPIDSGDTATNWPSSDTNTLTVSQETTLKQEGTGSIHLEPINNWDVFSHSRRKIITLTNSSGSTQTDYQVRLPITYDADMQTDFDDLRFYNSSGTQLNYWRESYSAGSSAVVWVKVDSIAAGSSTTIYMYYGNSTAGSASSIPNTFISDAIFGATGGCNNSYCNAMDNHSEADWLRQNQTASSVNYEQSTYNTSGGDYFFRRFRFLFVADESGTWTFGTNSDDGSELTIFPGDGYGGGYYTAHPLGAHTVVANWYGAHGSATCGSSGTTSTASLTAGQGYWMDYMMTEITGGQLAQACAQRPGGSFYTIDINNYDVYARKYTSGAEPTGSFGGEQTIVGQTATRTISATDFSSFNQLSFYVRSNRTGQFMRFQFGESSSNEQTYDITINSSNTWEQKTFDLSAIAGSNRDAVTKLALAVTDSSADFDFYFDNLQGDINSGTVLSTLINASDFSLSNYWTRLEFTDDETNGDIKYQVYYDNAGTPTIIPDTDLAGNSTGFDTSPVDLSGLSTTTYPAIYLRAVLTNIGGTPILQDWSVILNSPPNTPTLDSPPDTSTNVSLTPTLKTTASDPDSDFVQYKIELCTDAVMTTNCQTFDQTSSQIGWSQQNTSAESAYTSGSQGAYTIQTPLVEATTYYWRSYAIDPSGANTWSGTQSTPYSFTTLLLAPAQCVIRETEDDSSLTVEWTNDSYVETGYEVERDVNSAGFAALITKPANATFHQDNTVAKPNAYQYRARATTGSVVSNWCTTSTLNLGSTSTQNIQFEGLQMEGLQLN